MNTEEKKSQQHHLKGKTWICDLEDRVKLPIKAETIIVFYKREEIVCMYDLNICT